ncbi:hypothetical protein J437_LFUL002749 [Ladona fulva]|uniref:Failed axon connections n=1 Tax=Ladona fulva TaxID=123851 RepID=A0A8K0NVQ4_LADFU|nr:hypothetical protein J437_LFUL002749 [Ladona fulva]
MAGEEEKTATTTENNSSPPAEATKEAPKEEAVAAVKAQETEAADGKAAAAATTPSAEQQPPAPPRPSVHKPNFEKDIVYLYQFCRTPLLPSISPYCLKVETWLRLAGVKYERLRPVWEHGVRRY